MGYGNKTKGYRLYDKEKKKIIFSRDVIFNESSRPKEELTPLNQEEEDKKEDQEEEEDKKEDQEEEEEFTDCEENDASGLRKSSRVIKKPARFDDYITYSACFTTPEPKNINEALSGPEKVEWKNAIDEEMDSMNRNSVWELVKSNPKQKVVGCKWVFRRKINPDGDIQYKARLVGQGFNQILGQDYEETYSPVVRFETVRSIISLSASHGMIMHHMDVSSAFLNGTLKEEIYMRQPPGITIEGKEDYVCKLSKSIYGLKQSSKCWFEEINKTLVELDFKQSPNDSCLYVYRSEKVTCFIALYVDDLLISCNFMQDN